MADFPYTGIEDFDPQQQRFLRRLIDSHNNMGQQINAAPIGDIPAPPAHTAATVTGGGGVLHVQIANPAPQYRGAHNFVDVSKDGSFSSFQTFSDGPSTTIRRPVPNGTYHTRTYSQFPTSKPSPFLNHGMVTIGGTEQPSLPAGDAKVGFGAARYTTPLPPKRA